jgi:xanthine/uracil permease
MPALLSFFFSSSITVGALVAVIVNLIIPEVISKQINQEKNNV